MLTSYDGPDIFGIECIWTNTGGIYFALSVLIRPISNIEFTVSVVVAILRNRVAPYVRRFF